MPPKLTIKPDRHRTVSLVLVAVCTFPGEGQRARYNFDRGSLLWGGDDRPLRSRTPSPSILFYDSGNNGISEEHVRHTVAVRDRFDPHGGPAIRAREMLGSHSAECSGEMLYINKPASKPNWAHEYNWYEGARKFWDEQIAPFHSGSPLYNRNQNSFTL